MKKVLVVLPELDVGGGQKMAVEIAAHIKDEQVHIKILSFYPRRNTIIEQSADKYCLDIQYLSKHSGVNLGLIKQINACIREYKPDVIHAHLRVMPYLLLPMVLNKVPLRFYTVHNLADKDAKGIKRKILKFAFCHCNVIPVAISELCRDSIVSVYGVQKNQIPCIYVSINTANYKRPTAYSMLDSKAFRFIAIGRLMAQKNYSMMLSAFKRIYEIYPKSELTILGDGELRSNLEKELKELGIEEAVSLPGISENVNQNLWNSHVYLLSSDWEGLPQTVLEAMAAGVPIIATKAGGVTDVLVDGRNGMLVNVGDCKAFASAMLRMIYDSKLRETISANNEYDAQDYDIQVCSNKYLDLYLE